MLQQKKTQIKKWPSLKSIGLGESDLDYDVEMFFKFEVDMY